MVFARSFRDAKAADVAFASNMLGAAVGGALEYVSLWLGTRALLAVAAALYAAAWLFVTRVRVRRAET